MMNILALSLILITLGTSVILCPNPIKLQDVAVEFEKDDGKIKVSISPQEAAEKSGVGKGQISNAKEKTEQVKQRFKDAAAVLPNVGQGISALEKNLEDFGNPAEANPTEAVGRAKEAVAEKAREAMGREEEVKARAKAAVSEVEEGAKWVTEKAKGGAGNIEKIAQANSLLNNSKGEGKKKLKEILGQGREVVYDIFVYILSRENVRALFGMGHLLGLAIAYGMCVWVTFISSYVLGMALPKHQFATIQSKIYPLYFKAMAYSVGTAFLGHFFSQRRWPYSNSMETYLGFNLLAPLLMLLVNLFYLEPRATKVMLERMKMEKEEGRGINIEPNNQIIRVSKRLKNLNSQSSFLNVLTLMALSLHLAFLSQRFYIFC